MKFRNYLPHDEQLRGGKVAPVSLPKFEDPISAETAEPNQVEVLSWYSQILDPLFVLLIRYKLSFNPSTLFSTCRTLLET